MLNTPIGQTFSAENLAGLAPRQRIHLILLAVTNVAASTEFYQRLGWKIARSSSPEFTKIDLGGHALCLISRSAFAQDALQPETQPTGFSGIGFIYLAQTAEEVPRILAKAEEAGGTIVKPATRTAWGIAGYFKDPDGHLFEVDFEETWVFDQNHHLVIE